jgi:hypothetical protein
MPGPPLFFSRRKGSIPVPMLSLFMKRYKISLHWKRDLIMNRQTWTNEKQYLSAVW